MTKTAKQMITETLDDKQSSMMFWPNLSTLLCYHSPPEYMKDINGSWDKGVAALERWLTELDTPHLIVKDIPQRVTIVKECARTAAMWLSGDNAIDVDNLDGAGHMSIPVPLILAMADAIRKNS